ncbi:Kelch repeat-containing protein [Aliidiomarina iranensis]|nr:kelch repeat-containing protein [Aliidiomarina iranensis]
MLTHRFSLKSLFAVVLIIILSGCASSMPPPETFKLNSARYGHTAVADDSAIYVFGGSNESGFHRSVERIDPVTKNSEVLPVQLLPRRYASAVWDGKHSIYIFGGVGIRRGQAYLESTIEILNTRNGRVTRTQMASPRRFNSAVFLNGDFYVVGGSVFDYPVAGESFEYQASSLVTAYNFEQRQMLQFSDLPNARETSVFAHNGKVCAIGGYDTEQTYSRFDCLNPMSDTWESMPDAPVAVSAHSSVVHGDTLYVFGDYTNQSQVLTFNFNSGEWAFSDIPFQGSRHHAAVVFDDEIFVMGGTNNSSGPALDMIQVFKVSN